MSSSTLWFYRECVYLGEVILARIHTAYRPQGKINEKSTTSLYIQLRILFETDAILDGVHQVHTRLEPSNESALYKYDAPCLPHCILLLMVTRPVPALPAEGTIQLHLFFRAQ